MYLKNLIVMLLGIALTAMIIGYFNYEECSPLPPQMWMIDDTKIIISKVKGSGKYRSLTYSYRWEDEIFYSEADVDYFCNTAKKKAHD
jgi:hypothetical protein